MCFVNLFAAKSATQKLLIISVTTRLILKFSNMFWKACYNFLWKFDFAVKNLIVTKKCFAVGITNW